MNPRRPIAAAVLLALSLALAVQARAPRFELEHLDIEDGLSHSTVWDIYQDAKGFLWFASQDGLNRYDGYRIKVFRHRPGDPHSLHDNDVLEIFEGHGEDLWLRTRTGLERFDPLTERFFEYQLDPTQRGAEDIHFVFKDQAEQVWVSAGAGFYGYHRDSDRFEPIDLSPRDPQDLRIWDLESDTNGDLWIATSEGLCHLERSTQEVRWSRHDPEHPQSLGPGAVYGLRMDDEEGGLWVGGESGIYRFETAAQGFVSYEKVLENGREVLFGEAWVFLEPSDSGQQVDALRVFGSEGLSRWDREQKRWVREGGSALEGVQIYHGLEDPDGIWLATEAKGIYRWDKDRERFDHFEADPNDPYSLSGGTILDLYRDTTGILWIATYGGIDKYDSRREQFKVYRARPRQGNLSGDGIWGIHEDRRGELWIGTYAEGLNRLGQNRETLKHYGVEPESAGFLPSPEVTSIVEDLADNLWIGTYQGLLQLDLDRRRVAHFQHDPEDPESLSSSRVFSLYLDRLGKIWVSSGVSLDHLDPYTGRIQRYQHDPENPDSLIEGRVYAVLEDHTGALWVGQVGGLSRLDPKTGRAVNYLHTTSEISDQRAVGIAALHEDAQGVLWIGTYGEGLSQLDPDRQRFRHYREADGLPSSSVLGILEDSQGRLWLSTYNGLSVFDPSTEIFRNYGVSDGLPGAVFSSGSSLRSAGGEMFFGSVQGLLAFYPDQILGDPHPPRLALTDFKLLYESTPFGSVGSPLKNPIERTRELTLNHRQYVFSFEMAALHYGYPEGNRYAYRLDPFNADWITTDASNRSAQYSNLDPGEYFFRWRAANKDGVWSDEDQVRVVVLPAPWETWWAYSLYGLALLAAIGAVIRRQQRKIEDERAMSQRLRMVNRMKDELLANTSHELRTPLYGMTGLAEALVDGAKGDLPADVKRDLSMISASGQRLAGMVDDILDFSKLREDKMELQAEPVDLHALADVVVTLSQPLVAGKNVELLSSISPDLPAAAVDAARIQQVLYNLVGNAAKFTSEGRIDVSARQENAWLEVSVSDTGIGISTEHQERIFESFEQADASTAREHGGAGLGLAISRRLIDAHGGRLWVDSEVGKGSRFRFTVPVSDQPATETPVAAKIRRVSSLGSEDSAAELPLSIPLGESTLLVVDDEPVIREVLINHLRAARYTVRWAANGEEALHEIESSPVDLVLLDVMMPKMSGYEVCRRVREERSREELPIIFLSAKNQVENLVSGFSEGANDYLTKPISKGELLARVATHLDLLRVHRQSEQEAQTLRGLLPICCQCKKIRDDAGEWTQLELYVRARSEAEFSHGLCPDCGHAALQNLSFE